LENIVGHKYHISKEDRNRQNKHRSFVIWFTGLSGSGKSSIANQLERKLFDLGIKTYSLDGDNVRGGLNKDLTFKKEDRTENTRRVAEVARLFMDAGLVTISAFISPLAKDRQSAKEIVGSDKFIEVFVNTPLEICEERDVKGFYEKARLGEIENFTGISSPYEEPANPDIEIKTENETIEASVEKIFLFLKDKLAYNE
jgi:adenylylsulfate kinase